MRFDNKIIQTFLPKIPDHRHDFFVIDNILSTDDSDKVVVMYRDPFSGSITISKSEYIAREISIKRSDVLNSLGI